MSSLRWIVCAAPLFGCAASTTETEAPRHVVPPSFEERLAKDPTWAPGDAEPIEQEVRRFGPHPWSGPLPHDILIRVSIRNRCSQPATFAVGPDVDLPPADAPFAAVAAGEAVAVWIGSNEHVHLRKHDGSPLGHASPSRHLVLLAGDACENLLVD